LMLEYPRYPIHLKITFRELDIQPNPIAAVAPIKFAPDFQKNPFAKLISHSETMSGPSA
jgi:hypothetical protein